MCLPRCTQPSLSFTLQFKKIFKLVRLLNMGVLAKVPNFEPLVRRRRRRPEGWWWFSGVRGRISRRHQSLHGRIQPSSSQSAKKKKK